MCILLSFIHVFLLICYPSVDTLCLCFLATETWVRHPSPSFPHNSYLSSVWSFQCHQLDGCQVSVAELVGFRFFFLLFLAEISVHLQPPVLLSRTTLGSAAPLYMWPSHKCHLTLANEVTVHRGQQLSSPTSSSVTFCESCCGLEFY